MEATAGSNSAELKRLREYKAGSEKSRDRWTALAEIDIDINEDWDYWMGLDDRMFDFVLAKCTQTRDEAVAKSEKRALRVPPMLSQPSLSDWEVIRKHLDDRRRGG